MYNSDNSILLIGLSMGAALGLIAGSTISSCNNHYYKKTDKVQSGYVVPSRLEVELVDLDGDSKQETTLKYDGRRYLLLQSEQGEVSLKMYGVK